jgi:two-component system sensor histidine kinase RegB
MASPSDRFSLNAQWLIRLRWVAVVGQLLTIAAVMFGFGIKLDTAWALEVVISLTAVSNLVLSLWLRRWTNNPGRQKLPGDLILGLVMVMDMLSLTALLFATGGPNNPFMLFFFVNISLCAVVLNRNWAWALNLLSIVCFLALVYDHHQLDQLNLGIDLRPIRERGTISLVQIGLIVAFSTCGSVIVYFMTRLADELRKQQIEVRKAQLRQARSEKLEALGTLAAGTAHELATPLSTIAVVARDVEKAFDAHPPDFPGAEEVLEDVHLIRSQLERCRGILDRMASHSGQVIGEMNQPISMKNLIESILAELPERNRITVDLPELLAHETMTVPVIGFSQALRGLVQNAIDADPTGKPVEIQVDRAKKQWRLQIKDRGEGMSRSTLDRVSEPFFTTKQPGKGMGLGVFLAQNVIKRLNGKIEFASRPDRGTCVTVWLPLEIKHE